ETGGGGAGDRGDGGVVDVERTPSSMSKLAGYY
ncbi:hypothetical protein KIPB_005273, partial [Kipferlia bialata]